MKTIHTSGVKGSGWWCNIRREDVMWNKLLSLKLRAHFLELRVSTDICQWRRECYTSFLLLILLQMTGLYPLIQNKMSNSLLRFIFFSCIETGWKDVFHAENNVFSFCIWCQLVFGLNCLFVIRETDIGFRLFKGLQLDAFSP